ncbi:ergothioneine biosynthesis protein EgtC [Actinobacteria bacterium YIM 96077]|uniref:Gamma-glutamyl-hercynylcysteine sulfoxide hydrolase n=1 Tax=Phytoactinopolyspora halophila TaxID=1981511 RepID=A0A329QYZ5_9ACTN|nr:ergothioneine biosynthesis protein EgtC [Phytoactinopolyspora halophila]AYY13216.1 ergothioneine biosynthesis protein EgtC [Actinobacteria bacterium YIM 96077]RAW17545.1 ergothioneine biosynthesis protein EgtC [Phytoactinopolyspora halophila]
MCRHLAYLGTPASLAALLLDPPHSLVRQSYAPALQRHGTVNVDGFGAGWYPQHRTDDPQHRTAPVRYRRAQPIWSDASFASLAPAVEARCVLGAVRGGTPGFPADESCVAPFTHGPWLFSHNGKVTDWARVRKTLREAVADIPDALAPVDSAFLFGLAVARWEGGDTLGGGLAGVMSDVARAGGGWLNLLATDGHHLAATVHGDTLYLRTDPGSVVIASEPVDDDPAWTELPPDSLVEASLDGVTRTDLRVEHV